MFAYLPQKPLQNLSVPTLQTIVHNPLQQIISGLTFNKKKKYKIIQYTFITIYYITEDIPDIHMIFVLVALVGVTY